MISKCGAIEAINTVFKVKERNEDILSVLKESFVNACNTNNKKAKVQIGSILYGANLTRAQMEAFMEKDISEQLFTQMHYHFDRWGPGGIAIEERAVLRGQDWKKITVGNVSAYLIHCGVKTASISVVTTDDDGEKVEIAKIISVEDKHKLIKDYQKLRKREIEQKKPTQGLLNSIQKWINMSTLGLATNICKQSYQLFVRTKTNV